ncbi:autophagy-related protein [Sphaerosporella brunnea]|uniref:Autophagy-related protein 101 n=1 Tax=Sphaerosporella brunnea TaxID=1250544 RepID=A0A5J5F4F5_9PEZI|nr:autophagy-related protein [Sphaerosporella brunnea]
MDQPPVFTLDVLTDRQLLSDVLKGVLTTLFFHRLFNSLRPRTRDLLDLTLPTFDDAELEASIDARLATLARYLSVESAAAGERARLQVQFFEKRPRRAGWFGKAEEKVCWEEWRIEVEVVGWRSEAERATVRERIEEQLHRTVLKIITTASNEKSHVPPITTNDANPFPYAIALAPKGETWGTRMGIF